jgi:hypothetical protein
MRCEQVNAKAVDFIEAKSYDIECSLIRKGYQLVTW